MKWWMVLLVLFISIHTGAVRIDTVPNESRVIEQLTGVKVVPSEMSFQGYLEDAAGNPITGTAGMAFRIYDAETGGTLLWSETHPTVLIDKGYFVVRLGSITPMPADIFDNINLWLEIVIDGETLSPRMKLTSTGWAYKSHNADIAYNADYFDGHDWNEVPTSEDYIDEGQPAGGDLAGAYPDPTVAKLQGRPVSNVAPIEGQVLKWDGTQWSPGNDNVGAGFWTQTGSVLYPNDTAWTIGIGTLSPDTDYKLDVNGRLRVKVSGTIDGVRISAGGEGIHISSAGNEGIHISNVGGNGIYINHATYNGLKVDTVGSDGIWIQNAGDDGLHIVDAGDKGVCIMYPGQDGIYIDNAGRFGVHIHNTDNYGVVIENSSAGGIYIGDAEDEGVLINNVGSHGIYIMNTPGTGYALYGAGSIHVYGDISCDGTKSAVVRTETGPRKLFCIEAPEVWLEDFGTARLTNGYCRVELREDFLELVSITDKYPMKVFVTPLGKCNGVYVQKGDTYFEVYELNNGKSNIEFDWRVVAKRKDYEDVRLPIEEDAYTDRNLYPDDLNPDIPAKWREKRLKEKEKRIDGK